MQTYSAWSVWNQRKDRLRSKQRCSVALWWLAVNLNALLGFKFVLWYMLKYIVTISDIVFARGPHTLLVIWALKPASAETFQCWISVITFTTRGGRQKVHSAGSSLRCDHVFGAVCLLWSRSHQKKTDHLPSCVQNSPGLVLQRCEYESQTLRIVIQLAFIPQIFHISVHLDNVTHFYSLHLTVDQNRNGTQLI